MTTKHSDKKPNALRKRLARIRASRKVGCPTEQLYYIEPLNIAALQELEKVVGPEMAVDELETVECGLVYGARRSPYSVVEKFKVFSGNGIRYRIFRRMGDSIARIHAQRL
jgi:hypothetical protein